MCEFCAGTHPESAASDNQQQSIDTAAGTLLSREANAVKPSASNEQQTAADRKQPVGPTDPIAPYGLSRRVNEAGHQEFFYRANGKDNVVLKTSLDMSSAHLVTELDKIMNDRIATLERRYAVDFATPGEEVAHQEVGNNSCDTRMGPMMRSIQPSFPAVLAIEESLKRSAPSQFDYDGKTGAKIYFLDRKPAPNIYGNRPILGYYTTDRDGRAALYLTPAGLALPATARDAPEGSRNLSWVMSHEIAHNSQRNNYSSSGWAQRADAMGWDGNLLKGKNGERFTHASATCSEPSAWYLVNREGKPLNAQGKLVDSLQKAQKLTNEQVQERALVRPITYYFMNAEEMLTEGLTAFRSGRESRAKLLRESPALYEVAKKYDQEEIGKHYGLDANGKTKFLRTPEGFVVRREEVTERSIRLFEKGV